LDWLTFISNLIRDVAWPLVTLLALLVLLRRGPSIVRFVKAIKYKDFEVTMREDFIEARAEVERVKVEIAPNLMVSINPKDKVLQLAEIDPALAVIEIWKKLEAALIKLIQHHGLMRFTTPDRMVVHLGKLGKLSKSEVNLFRKLREIRNESVHAHDKSRLTLAEVIEFKDFVDVLIQKFEKMMSEAGYIDIPKT
jgi:hypothetical protein